MALLQLDLRRNATRCSIIIAKTEKNVKQWILIEHNIQSYNMIYNEFQMRDVNFEIDFEGEREGKHESGIVLGTDERAGQH